MNDNWTHCYRLPKQYRNSVIACTVMFAVLSVVSVVGSLINPDGSIKHPLLAALVFGLFWLSWTLGGLWTLLLYRRYRLCVSDDALRQVAIRRDQRVEFRQVNKLRWQLLPRGGNVRMSGAFGVVKIDLSSLNAEDREEIIFCLRSAIAEHKQSGWEASCERFTDTPEKRRRRKRSWLLLTLAFGVQTIVFGIVAVMFGNGTGLPMAVVSAMVTLYMLRRVEHDQPTPAWTRLRAPAE